MVEPGSNPQIRKNKPSELDKNSNSPKFTILSKPKSNNVSKLNQNTNQKQNNTNQINSNDKPKNPSSSNNSDKKRGKQRNGQSKGGSQPSTPNNGPVIDYKKHPIYIRIEEINNCLRNGVISIPESQRSPSPEPLFNADGKQINTREIRYRKKLEEERQNLIEEALKEDANFKLPLELRKPAKLQEKYFIPVESHPDINFIGLLIGPRGNTLKRMELDSGAKISIRGRGSVKEGKRFDLINMPGNEEDLHCLITADSIQKIKKAKKLIEKIIETSASVPEGQNELKRQQLRELAALNGTLRDDEGPTCGCCGLKGHRKSDCIDVNNPGFNKICHICKEKGLTLNDCNHPIINEIPVSNTQLNNAIDKEISQLMEEVSLLPRTSQPIIEPLSIQYNQPFPDMTTPNWHSNGPSLIPSPNLPLPSTLNGFNSDPGLSTRSSIQDKTVSPGVYLPNGHHGMSELFSNGFSTSQKSLWPSSDSKLSSFMDPPSNQGLGSGLGLGLGLGLFNNSPSLGTYSPNYSTLDLSSKISEPFLTTNSSGNDSPLFPPPPPTMDDPLLPWVSLSGPKAGEDSEFNQ